MHILSSSSFILGLFNKVGHIIYTYYRFKQKQNDSNHITSHVQTKSFSKKFINKTCIYYKYYTVSAFKFQLFSFDFTS